MTHGIGRYVLYVFFFFQAEDGIRDLVRSRGLGDVYKRQAILPPLLLQPLVENAVCHGVEPSPLGADVRISTQRRGSIAVSYTHLRAHETVLDLVCRLLLEHKKKQQHNTHTQSQQYIL